MRDGLVMDGYNSHQIYCSKFVIHTCENWTAIDREKRLRTQNVPQSAKEKNMQPSKPIKSAIAIYN